MGDHVRDTIRFRSLRRYKYQLRRAYTVDTPIRLPSSVATHGGFVCMTADGGLTMAAGYAWDGPSGPTVDTPSFMRGSLVHDGLYQLIREGLIGMEHRKAADQLLREHCRQDGMGRLRAAYVYRAVRWFGAKHAKPRPVPDDQVAP